MSTEGLNSAPSPIDYLENSNITFSSYRKTSVRLGKYFSRKSTMRDFVYVKTVLARSADFI